MQYAIGRRVYNLIPDEKMDTFNAYLNEQNIDLSIIEGGDLSSFFPVDSEHQADYMSLLKKDEWFHVIGYNKPMSKYFYKDIESLELENRISIGVVDILN